jgi:predicted AlkP superfamily phosphohydrolase/phosphomutase
MRERERMMLHELERFREGFFFCLFDTPDRVQHMVWRFREADHPALAADAEFGANGAARELAHAVEDNYVACDAVVGKALEYAGDDTLVIVLSDHGFGSFRRGVHLNSWLHANGYLALRPGAEPGADAGEFFHDVDWENTRAYALGLGSVYLNVKDREAAGTVAAADGHALADEIAERLAGLVDPATGDVAVRGAAVGHRVYSGEFAGQGPDLVVRFASGYRVSWATALGGVPAGIVEDNVKRWSGDHIIDPALVRGVLFANRALRGDASLLDLAPTILAALGAPKGEAMEGTSLLEVS